MFDEPRYLDWLLTLPGLVALWPLDDAVGSSTARDAKGIYPGTAIGGVSFGVPGVAGKTAARFDGSGDGIRISTTSVGLRGFTNMTAFAWVLRIVGTSAQALVGSGNNTGSWNWMLRNTTWSFRTASAGYNHNHFTGSEAVPQLLLGTYDGERQRIYRNGMLLEDDAPQTGVGSTSSYPLHIGSWGGTLERLNGDLSFVGVCNQALDAATIAQIYRRGIA
jgi:hypothetical protein